MSQAFSDHPQELVRTPTDSPKQPGKLSRPGWPGVVVNAVFNLSTVPAMVLVGMG